ncbi:MAG TPA: RNA polymerase sigma factor FliA [Chromatiaceae bacterium]|nr:RNA polymerase sigma factor FliA [Chromatiaceae bacterium]
MNGLATYNAVAEQSYDELVNQHAALVKRIAYHLMSRLPPNVQVEDLVQAGMIGLLEASRNYDPSQGASFETYAGIRIRGSMLDEIRRSDWTPRSVHRKARMVAEAIRQIENAEGRDARDSEVAEALEMTVEEYHAVLKDSNSARIFSFDELSALGEVVPEGGNRQSLSENPMEGLYRSDFRKALTNAIAGLPDRERMVIGMYYQDELNLREIGQVLGVSESRVCQIHSQAALRLRARLKEWLSDRDEAKE